MRDDLREAAQRQVAGALADLDRLIQIPSVSADPLAASEVRRSAALTASLFAEAGMPQVEVLQLDGGAPAVLAHYPAPAGQPTVLFYAHHDVQPTGSTEAWTSPPFEPTCRDGRLYGRGSADDKAGIAAHLAAIRAYEGRPPVGVTVFVEGEEEIGSPMLSRYLDHWHDRLAADVIVLADSENFAVGQPAFTTTLRGLTSCLVEIRTLTSGVHSGTYGGAVPDALTAMCRLLASLHDDQGDVDVEGLVIAEPPGLSYPESRFRTEAGLLDRVPLIGTGALSERIWAKPSATVLALDATAVDQASNTLSPSARAKIGLRLAPGDDPERAGKALARHLRHHAPWGLEVEVTVGETGRPFSIDTSGPAFAAAHRAYGDAYGHKVVETGGGGSIPFVAEFADAFPDAAILITSPGSDPSCQAHGVDENLHLEDFARACLAETLLLAELTRRSNET